MCNTDRKLDAILATLQRIETLIACMGCKDQVTYPNTPFVWETNKTFCDGSVGMTSAQSIVNQNKPGIKTTGYCCNKIVCHCADNEAAKRFIGDDREEANDTGFLKSR